MAKIEEIYEAIDKISPFSSAMDFDNVGLIVGSKNSETENVLIALDITNAVIDEAIKLNAKLVISHHPIIFNPIKSLDERDIPYMLAKNGIAAICAHTNLDIAKMYGVNAALAKVLGLVNIRCEPLSDGFALFFGEIPKESEPKAFAEYVKSMLNADSVSCHLADKAVKTVALCSGAGGDYLDLAEKMGVDAFVTGEMKHNERIDAARLNMTVIAAGHYETEKIFGENLAEILIKKVKGVNFFISEEETSPFEHI